MAIGFSSPDDGLGDGLADVDVAVLAGGLGTRISGVLGDTPKALAPVGDQPFLACLLDHLRSFGARRVVLCLGHLAERITGWLDAGGCPAGMEVVCRVEPAPMGTAGALSFARDALRTDPVLVLNGDTFIDADLGAFVAAHRHSTAAASILCTVMEDASRYGCVDVDDGYVRRFTEKAPGPGIINAGVYLFAPTFLDHIAATNARSLEHDVLERQPPGTMNAVVVKAAFIDIGTPESLAAASGVIPPPRL